MTRSSQYDLNDVLSTIDRYSDRRALAVMRALHRAACSDKSTAVASGLLRQALEEVMMRAHVRALSVLRDDWALRDGWAASAETTLKKLTKQEKESLRELYGSIARSATDKAMTHVREQLVESITDRKSVASALTRAGVSRRDHRLLATVTRTHSSMSFNASTFAAGIRDPDVWGFEYVTARDDRVRDEHRRIHGVRYPKDHEFWSKYAPPNGWNCRCMLRVVRKGSSKARTRAMRGQAPFVDSAFRVNSGKLVLQSL